MLLLWVQGAGALSASSLLMFAAEALICYGEAKAQLKGKEPAQGQREQASALQLAPLISTTRLTDGKTTGLYGLTGSF